MRPASTAASELATAQPVSLWQWMPRRAPADGAATSCDDVAAPRRAASRRWCRTGRRPRRPPRAAAQHGLERVGAVVAVAVEEVLGVEEDPPPLAAEEARRCRGSSRGSPRGWCAAPARRAARRLGDEGDHRGAGVSRARTSGSSAARVPARRVAPNAASVAFRRSSSSWRPLEELGVLGVRARPAALDEADAELVEVRARSPACRRPRGSSPPAGRRRAGSCRRRAGRSPVWWWCRSSVLPLTLVGVCRSSCRPPVDACPAGVCPGHKKTPRGTGGLRVEGCSSRYSIMSEARGRPCMTCARGPSAGDHAVQRPLGMWSASHASATVDERVRFLALPRRRRSAAARSAAASDGSGCTSTPTASASTGLHDHGRSLRTSPPPGTSAARSRRSVLPRVERGRAPVTAVRRGRGRGRPAPAVRPRGPRSADAGGHRRRGTRVLGRSVPMAAPAASTWRPSRRRGRLDRVGRESCWLHVVPRPTRS